VSRAKVGGFIGVQNKGFLEIEKKKE